MEKNQPKTGKFALNYGILLGIISIVFGVMLYLAGLHYEQSISIFLINIAIMTGVITFGIYEFRKANSNLLNLSDALKVGVGIALIGAIIGIVYQMVFMNFIEPDFMENVLALRKSEMIADNPSMTQEEVDNATEMMNKFSGAGISAAFGLIGGLFFGLIISLISGLILKKQEAVY